MGEEKIQFEKKRKCKRHINKVTEGQLCEELLQDKSETVHNGSSKLRLKDSLYLSSVNCKTYTVTDKSLSLM